MEATEVTQGDRTTAAAMHVGSIFAPVLVPAVSYVAFRRSSRFVAAHSLQALYETFALNLLLLVVGIASLSYTAVRLYGYYQNDWQDFSIWEFLVRFGLNSLADLPKIEDMAEALGFDPPAGLIEQNPREDVLPLDEGDAELFGEASPDETPPDPAAS